MLSYVLLIQFQLIHSICIISDRNASLYKSENFDTSHEFHNGISITCDIRCFILQVELLQKIQEIKFHSTKLTAVKISYL
jgi:hypothetical protein